MLDGNDDPFNVPCPKGRAAKEKWKDDIAAKVAGRSQQYQGVFDAHEATRVGVNPHEPYHYVTNPTREELDERERRWDAYHDDKKRKKQTSSQLEHWNKAVQFIKSGQCHSYEVLGQQFKRSRYDRQRPGEPYGAHWAALLVRKMIIRGDFTKAEIARLIPDRSSPFKRSKPFTQTGNTTPCQT